MLCRAGVLIVTLYFIAVLGLVDMSLLGMLSLLSIANVIPSDLVYGQMQFFRYLCTEVFV